MMVKMSWGISSCECQLQPSLATSLVWPDPTPHVGRLGQANLATIKSKKYVMSGWVLFMRGWVLL